MHHLRKLEFTTIMLVFFFCGFASISMMTAFAEPKVEISPTCGPHEPGFNIVIDANGFTPNSNVAVKFVGSDSKIPLYTKYETNNTGGFSEVTFADDLREDNYRLYLADDTNDDNVFDIGAKRIYANITIPCPN